MLENWVVFINSYNLFSVNILVLFSNIFAIIALKASLVAT